MGVPAPPPSGITSGLFIVLGDAQAFAIQPTEPVLDFSTSCSAALVPPGGLLVVLRPRPS